MLLCVTLRNRGLQRDALLSEQVVAYRTALCNDIESINVQLAMQTMQVDSKIKYLNVIVTSRVPK